MVSLNTGSEIPLEFPLFAPPLTNFQVSDEKIRLKIIGSSNPSKARGWDDISARMSKVFDHAIVPALQMIFETCLPAGIFPQVCKQANLVPVHEKGSKNLKTNYCSISFLPLFGRMLEKLIFDTLDKHLNMHGLLDPNQLGFRPGASTIYQLLTIVHTVFEAFDCNGTLNVRSVYLDISKAFDRVWHDGLIFKLRRCGVSGQLLSPVESFLADRKQRTVLNGKASQ